MGKLAIWKFPIVVIGLDEVEFEIEMPEEFHVLTVQTRALSQQGCIWALVNPESAKRRRGFVLRGTGVTFDGDLRYAETDPTPRYLGTFQTNDGSSVWHLFLKKQRRA